MGVSSSGHRFQRLMDDGRAVSAMLSTVTFCVRNVQMFTTFEVRHFHDPAFSSYCFLCSPSFSGPTNSAPPKVELCEYFSVVNLCVESLMFRVAE